MIPHRRLSPVLLISCLVSTAFAENSSDWPNYGNDLGGTRYSSLNQIDKSNVKKLTEVWQFSTEHIGKIAESDFKIKKTAFQATPIMVDRTLFFCSPLADVFALDAVTGKLLWSRDSNIEGKVVFQFTCRGVSTWNNPEAQDGQLCSRQIFTGTSDAKIIALDSKTGKPCPDFGNNGEIDLKEGLGDVKPAEYAVESPPTVIKNLVITGAGIMDNWRTSAPSGVIRAFDARTGKLVWAWNPVPKDYVRPAGESGLWARGTPNAWGIFSADEANDMIFIPTGSPSTDLFGGGRHARGVYGSSVVALRASTGEYLWHFQTVHHDLWDYDVAAQPSLFNLVTENGTRPAIAQATKVGHVFFLDRLTGESIFPIEERKVPISDIEGEMSSPTQPFPTRPPPLYEGTNPFRMSNPFCWKAIGNYRYEGVFTPPSLRGSVVYPGAMGGTNWSGSSIDPRRQIMILNQTNLPVLSTLKKKNPNEKIVIDVSGNTFGDYSLEGTPYIGRWDVLTNIVGIPCLENPMGELIAINITDGSIRWRKPWGKVQAGPMSLDSSPTLGGSLLTASGLVFISAGKDDYYLHAVDIESGMRLWKSRLPAPGIATPMTYSIDGVQYVVIAAGGHSVMQSPEDDKVVAFRLK